MVATHPTIDQVTESDTAPAEPEEMNWTDEKGLAPIADTVSTKAHERVSI